MEEDLIKKRAFLKSEVRKLLDKKGLIEVDVPLLGPEACPDPSSLPIGFNYQQQYVFLQPSPEYFIKRLIAKTPGNYYSLAPCFRDDPLTSRHNPEFLMLEYYLMGESFEEIQKLTQDILSQFIPSRPVEFLSYNQVFQKILSVDIQQGPKNYHSVLKKHNIDFNPSWDKEILEDLIFGTLCQKHLGVNSVTFVKDFPYHHRALAHFDANEKVAKRFEVFIDGLEVANGYQECICAQENQQRIQSWNATWRKDGKTPPNSNKFLKATKNLPPCSGVALGFDRMILLSTNKNSLKEILLFPWDDL